MKPANVRFYFDADILGLAKLIVTVRPDVTFPGDPGGTLHRRVRTPCVITESSTFDEDWIPVASDQGLLIITRDNAIQDHKAEIDAIRDNDGRMVALSGKEAKGTWEQLEILLCRWRSIEALLDLPGPFIYTATRTSLNKIL